MPKKSSPFCFFFRSKPNSEEVILFGAWCRGEGPKRDGFDPNFNLSRVGRRLSREVSFFKENNNVEVGVEIFLFAPEEAR